MRFILLMAAGAAISFGQATFSMPAQVYEVTPATPAQGSGTFLASPTATASGNRECAVAMPNSYREGPTKFPTPVVKPNQFAPMKDEVTQGLPVCRPFSPEPEKTLPVGRAWPPAVRRPEQRWDPELWNRFRIVPGDGGKDTKGGDEKDKGKEK
jgi:hypothetical protein